MKVSPHTQPESFLTASTLDSMIKRAKELNREYFTCTDHGFLHSNSKVYHAALKAKLKPILGLQFYFKDPLCDIVTGTTADRCKYFTGTIYAKDQEAYQALCKLVSRTDFSTTEIREEKQNLFTWKDLELLSKYNTNIVLGGIHCIVGKAFLASDANIGLKLFEKLNKMFPDRLRVALICEPWSKKYAKVVKVNYKDGTHDSFLAYDTVSTNRAKKIKAIDLAFKPGHFRIESKVINGIYSSVGKEYEKAELHSGYLPLPCDVTLKSNTLS